MSTEFTVVVFGKEGCGKCKALLGRLDRMFKGEEGQHFSLKYVDVSKSIGMVAMCKMECINPSRIPAFVVVDAHGVPLRNPDPGRRDDEDDYSMLYQHLGAQTDYSRKGNISPALVKRILTTAMQAAVPQPG